MRQDLLFPLFVVSTVLMIAGTLGQITKEPWIALGLLVAGIAGMGAMACT